MKKKGLKPRIDEKTVRILILGTFPGEESLRKREYYGNRRNQFWEIIFRVLGTDDPGIYKERIRVLQRSGIGLWDVIGSCERKGSADSAIKGIRINGLEKLNDCPKLEAIYFNGKKAEQLFEKNYDISGIKRKCLPSTSPAYAAMKVEEKARMWEVCYDRDIVGESWECFGHQSCGEDHGC